MSASWKLASNNAMGSPIPFIPPFELQGHLFELWRAAQVHSTGMTVLMGFLVAAVCGWIGCYLILQGMALLGDAISHTVLLGIVVVALTTSHRGGVAMFVGAALTGLITTLLIEALHSTCRVKEDAAIGIVFTSLFALGVALNGILAGHAHIDKEHILFGNLEMIASGETVSLIGLNLPRAIAQMGAMAVVVALLIVAFYKELLVVAFDRQLAASLGFRPRLVRYGMMGILSMTVVAAFESVGAVLVVAMLIIPPATSYLLTRRLPIMLLWSTVIAAVCSLAGFHMAIWLDVSIAGAMVTVATFLFGLAFLFSPERGLIAVARRRWLLRWRMCQENMVRQLLKTGATVGGVPAEISALAAALSLRLLTTRAAAAALRQRGWIETPSGSSNSFLLTARGVRQAERLDRAHRLWETFLVEQVGLKTDHVHPTAEEVEHLLSEQLVEKVDDALGHPAIDPHGAPIPRSPISDRAPGVFSLSKLRVGDRARIVGMCDPASVTDQTLITEPDHPLNDVAQLGLTLGQIVIVARHESNLPTWWITLPDGASREISHGLADAILVQQLGTPPAQL